MIEAGQRLGPYEIVAPIGAGGMGEVWKALDTRLDRHVAVKVLPAALAADAKLNERFDREAKAISALSHPHICTLHDVGHEGGTSFLVMEYLEGESLADRLRRGPLPMNEVLRYGQHIAQALEAAHRRGIVHRDLKPGNVMLTRSGAKLLDFGLARTAAAPVSGAHASDSPTEKAPLTAEGTILGTFQYMAPEQLEGLEADARTDIFAFGVVLYEMVTGRRAFRGESRTSLIAAIVASQPQPIAELIPDTPPALEHVVRKCLEKNRDERWQSAHDVAAELQWISETGAAVAPDIAAGGTKRWKRRVLFAGLPLAFLVGLVAGTILLRAGAPESSTNDRVVRSEIALEPGVSLAGWGTPIIAISPDGRTIAYVGHDGAIQRLYIRRLDAENATLVPGSESAEGPFFSPDGK
ncbi:MAG TPA: protein kinase, partial [Thermoanaerobaculia bacterium]|nr:protein kinase [Thermoanaerobaculia bacterium]